jgi:hypothetical protein
MSDLSPRTGLGQFGRAYQMMLENDSHAPGSVDRVLMARMVRLCPETSAHLYTDYTSTESGYEPGTRPELEGHLKVATLGCTTAEERVDAIALFCAGLGARAPQDINQTVLGGTEEEIIARGSDWCTDVARVACVLYQVSGLAARMVYLADVLQAYSGHATVEVHRDCVWGGVDPTTGVAYRTADGTPASTWDLMADPDLVECHRQASRSAYARPTQFARAAISNYPIGNRMQYDYTVSGVNDYYRAILEMSDNGWPGGLRWLHGEDALDL